MSNIIHPHSITAHALSAYPGVQQAVAVTMIGSSISNYVSAKISNSTAERETNSKLAAVQMKTDKLLKRRKEVEDDLQSKKRCQSRTKNEDNVQFWQRQIDPLNGKIKKIDIVSANLVEEARVIREKFAVTQDENSQRITQARVMLWVAIMRIIPFVATLFSLIKVYQGDQVDGIRKLVHPRALTSTVLSVIPLFQQVIGLLMLSKIGSYFRDRSLLRQAKAERDLEMSKQLLVISDLELKIHQLKAGNDKRNKPRIQELERQLAAVLSRPDQTERHWDAQIQAIKVKIDEDKEYIATAFLRILPLVGTLFSLYQVFAGPASYSNTNQKRRLEAIAYTREYLTQTAAIRRAEQNLLEREREQEKNEQEALKFQALYRHDIQVIQREMTLDKQSYEQFMIEQHARCQTEELAQNLTFIKVMDKQANKHEERQKYYAETLQVRSKELEELQQELYKSTAYDTKDKSHELYKTRAEATRNYFIKKAAWIRDDLEKVAKESAADTKAFVTYAASIFKSSVLASRNTPFFESHKMQERIYAERQAHFNTVRYNLEADLTALHHEDAALNKWIGPAGLPVLPVSDPAAPQDIADREWIEPSKN